jgi:hypothetical protein
MSTEYIGRGAFRNGRKHLIHPIARDIFMDCPASGRSKQTSRASRSLAMPRPLATSSKSR